MFQITPTKNYLGVLNESPRNYIKKIRSIIFHPLTLSELQILLNLNFTQSKIIFMYNTQNSKMKGAVKVRVYVLLRIDQTTTSWEEVGTGYIAFISDISPDIQANDQFLVVSPLANGKISQLAHKIDRGRHPNYILYSRLDKINRYEKQEMTIISWEDRVLNYQIAISFIQRGQCQDYWKLICSKIGKNHLEIGNLNSDDILEDPTESNLNNLMQNVKTRQDLITYHVINKTSFMPSLKQLVNRLQPKLQQGLKLIHNITKNIIGYNDTRILQIFFSSQYFEMLLKILSVSEVNLNKVKYSQLYKQKQPFGTIVTFSPQYTEKIIMQHNISFYKEYILNIRMDTDLMNFLSKFYNQTNLDLINYLSKKNIMDKIASKIESEQFLRVLFFLSELIALLKQFQEQLRYGIMDSIYQSNILSALAKCGYDEKLMQGLQDKLIMYFQVFGNLGVFGQKMYLQFLKSNHNSEYSVIIRLAKAFILEHISIKKVISHFLKQQIFLSHPNDKTEWMQFLNSTFNKEIIERLRDYYDLTNNREAYTDNFSITLQCFLDFTITFVEQLNDHKIFKMYDKYNLLELAIKVFKTKSQKITILKFLKLIITKKEIKDGKEVKNVYGVRDGGKDPQIISYMIKSGLIDFLMETFSQNYQKNNLIMSVCMEIFNLIISRNLQSVIKVLVTHRNRLPKIQIIQKILMLNEDFIVDKGQICQNRDSTQMVEEKEVLYEQKKHKNILMDQEQEKYLEDQPPEIVSKNLFQKNFYPNNSILESLQSLTYELSRYNEYRQLEQGNQYLEHPSHSKRKKKIFGVIEYFQQEN